jgi:hypothetical protein
MIEIRGVKEDKSNKERASGVVFPPFPLFFIRAILDDPVTTGRQSKQLTFNH